MDFRPALLVLVTYPGQGHLISLPTLLLDAMLRNLEWFDR